MQCPYLFLVFHYFQYVNYDFSGGSVTKEGFGGKSQATHFYGAFVALGIHS